MKCESKLDRTVLYFLVKNYWFLLYIIFSFLNSYKSILF